MFGVSVFFWYKTCKRHNTIENDSHFFSFSISVWMWMVIWFLCAFFSLFDGHCSMKLFYNRKNTHTSVDRKKSQKTHGFWTENPSNWYVPKPQNLLRQCFNSHTSTHTHTLRPQNFQRFNSKIELNACNHISKQNHIFSFYGNHLKRENVA